MAKNRPSSYYKFFVGRFVGARAENKYLDALDSVAKGYLTAREIGDQSQTESFISMMELVIEDYIHLNSANDESSEKAHEIFCSFCGKVHAEVKKIIAGPTAYICNECVDLSKKICDE